MGQVTDSMDLFLRSLFGRAPERVPAVPVEREPLRVRALAPEDLPEVLRIEAASFPNAWSRSDFERMLADERASAHVLERDGACVGFFVVLRGAGHLRIGNLAVAPEARRGGLATDALRAIENIARAHGLPLVSLEVRETNLGAQLLYRKCGYRAVEVLRGHYGDQDGYRMTKDVARRSTV